MVFQTSKNPVYLGPLQKSQSAPEIETDSARRLTTKSIKLIHAAHAKATQAIEQHIAPGYEAADCTLFSMVYLPSASPNNEIAPRRTVRANLYNAWNGYIIDVDLYLLYELYLLYDLYSCFSLIINIQIVLVGTSKKKDNTFFLMYQILSTVVIELNIHISDLDCF